MVSAIDPTKPLDGVPAVKSELRDNLQAAKTEIEALQNESVLGQTGDVTITALAQQSSPASSAKVAVEQTDGSFRSVALADLPVVSTGSGDGTTNVQSAPFSAVGDGTTDDTTAIQAAIDATANDGVVYLPPGSYSVNRLNVPHNRAIKFQGASPWATTLVGRTAGEDIFRITDPGGATVQDRFIKVHVYENLGFLLNTGSGSPDLTTGLDRCTTAGLAVGPCCIAYVTDFVPSGTGNPGINAAWLHSFGVVSNCVVNVSTKHGNHGCGFIHHGANHYGWTYQNIWIEGGHYGVTDSLPFARRVTASGGSDRLTVANGANPFQNGQTLFVAAHNATGAMPGGLNRFQVYHVVNRDASGFQLSETSGGGAVNVSSNGSGAIYVYGAADFAGEYAPDGVSIDRLTHYAGRCPISLTNTENLHIGRVDSYGAIAALHLYAVESLTRKEHIGPVVDAYYSESPQAATMPPGEDIVHIDAVAGAIGYLQVRGESGDVTNPPVRFMGRGYRVSSLDLISSFSQAQPAIIIDGDNIGLFGRVHTACTLTDNGSDNYYLLTQDGGGWKFRSASPFL
ncbi:MAG: glycosyl hydrolase family 28-related protein [Geminicoccaceae bacterium]